MNDDGIHRVEIPEVPVEAIREAVINSFAHARYDNTGTAWNRIDAPINAVSLWMTLKFDIWRAWHFWGLRQEPTMAERLKLLRSMAVRQMKMISEISLEELPGLEEKKEE